MEIQWDIPNPPPAGISPISTRGWVDNPTFDGFFHGILASGNLTLNPLNGYIGLSKILIPLFIDGYIMLYPII